MSLGGGIAAAISAVCGGLTAEEQAAAKVLGIDTDELTRKLNSAHLDATSAFLAGVQSEWRTDMYRAEVDAERLKRARASSSVTSARRLDLVRLARPAAGGAIER